MQHSLPAFGLMLVLALVVATYIYADAADDILNGWGFTDDDE